MAVAALPHEIIKSRAFHCMQEAEVVVVAQEQIMARELQEVLPTQIKFRLRNRYRETPALPGHLLVAEQVALLELLARLDQQVVAVVLVEAEEPQEPQEPQEPEVVARAVAGLQDRAVAAAQLVLILLETHL